MRVLRRIGVGVVLAMNRHPLARSNSGSDPGQELEDVVYGPAERDAPVRQGPVEVDRGGEYCDLGHEESDSDHDQGI